MNIDVRHGLPFIEVTICYRGEELHLKNVLLAGLVIDSKELTVLAKD